MSNASTDRTAPEATAATRQAMAMLRSPLGPVDGGYIDLLDQRQAPSSHRSQRMFRSRLMPRIYERFSRPLASRIFFGPFGPGREGEGRIVMGMLQIGQGDRVLDVGCGPGNYTRRFATATGDGLAIGLDASATMLAVAVERGGDHVAYVRGDGADLPFADGEFDAIGCIGVLHVIEDPAAALDEMARVLAPGGRIAFMTTWSRMKRRRLRLFGGHVFGHDEVTEMLADRGLTDLEQRKIGFAQFVAARKPGA